jgi:hypothetical protein
MSDPNGEEENQDQSEGQSELMRDKKGRFAPKSQSAPNGQSQPSDSEYTKINSILAKQLGITDRLADYQTKHDPRELFKMLEFMVENSDNHGRAAPNANGLPPNQPVVPVSPEPSQIDLPGIKWNDKPNLSKDHFSASFRIGPKDLFKSNKK